MFLHIMSITFVCIKALGFDLGMKYQEFLGEGFINTGLAIMTSQGL